MGKESVVIFHVWWLRESYLGQETFSWRDVGSLGRRHEELHICKERYSARCERGDSVCLASSNHGV